MKEVDSLRFRHPAFYGLNYLSTKIFRVSSHLLMVACGSILLTRAVEWRRRYNVDFSLR